MTGALGLTGMRVAVVVRNYPIRRSPSILLLLSFLQKQGCNVVLVTDNRDAGPLIDGSVHHVSFTGTPLRKLAAMGRMRIARPDLAIAFEPPGFQLAAMFTPLRRIVYYSLELWDAPTSEYERRLIDFEKQNIAGIAGIVIQSRERESIFRGTHGVGEAIPAFHLPVCLGRRARSRTGRRLDSNRRKRLLHWGGLREPFGIPVFCESIRSVPDWELVMHGHGSDEDLAVLRRKIDNGDYPNASLLGEYRNSPFDAEQVCDQADAGLAWYENIDANHDTAALSSGKISAYLKHGLPLVLRDGKSFLELARQGCAVAIATPCELQGALGRIEADYERMSECAMALFDERYDFDNYVPALAEFLASRIAYGRSGARSVGLASLRTGKVAVGIDIRTGARSGRHPKEPA